MLGAAPAGANVDFYTDEAAWTAAVTAGAVDAFDTSPANVALADEVLAPPGGDADLGGQLTFRPASTGLCGGAVIRTLEPGASLVFDNGEPSPPVLPAGTLSIGDIDDSEDDDFAVEFPTDAFFAVGLFLVNNTQDPGESFSVFGATGFIAALPGSSIPDSSGNASTFLGVVATEPIASLRFDEDPGGDDVAIRDLRFGCAADDPDADGLSNRAEAAAGSDPATPDTDGDGLLDGREVGTGAFGPPVPITTAATGARTAVAADLDGDSDPDVLTASFGDDTVAWHENTDGAGGFGPRQALTTLADGVLSAAAADLDGDGDRDALAASYLPLPCPRGFVPL